MYFHSDFFLKSIYLCYMKLIIIYIPPINNQIIPNFCAINIVPYIQYGLFIKLLICSIFNNTIFSLVM